MGAPVASSENSRKPAPNHTADRSHVAQNVERGIRRTAGSAVIG
jgi:hypothetical protein